MKKIIAIIIAVVTIMVPAFVYAAENTVVEAESVTGSENESVVEEIEEGKVWTPDMVVTFYFAGGTREVYSYESPCSSSCQKRAK